MLHSIKLPVYDKNLEYVLQFQQQFVTFLCDFKTPRHPKDTDFEQAFRQETGQWFYKWLQKKSESKTTYYQLLCQLLDHINTHPNLRTEVINAFQHDIDFANHLTDVRFTFLFRKLDKTAQKLLKLLLVPFYDDIFYVGFPPSIAPFNRKQMLKIFWDTNSHLKVCPACDGSEIEINRSGIRCHVDHFFPKASYPFFTIYAKNLIPICSNCNSSYKGNKDPLVHTYPNPLVHTFHPFEKPALGELKIIIVRAPNGEKSVHLEDKKGGMSKRIERLNYVFALEERWTGRLDNEIEKIRIKIINYSRRHSHEYASNRALVERVLLDIEGDYDLSGREHSYVLRRSYVQYALSDSKEFEELVGLLP